MPASQVLAATPGAPQLSGHLPSGEDPGFPRVACRGCSEPRGLDHDGDNQGSWGLGGLIVFTCPFCCPGPAGSMDRGEHPGVGGHAGELEGPQAVVRFSVRLMPRSGCAD